MKNIAHGVIEISVGDTEEEEKDLRGLTDRRGDLSSIVEGKKITKEQEMAEFLQSIQDQFDVLKG